MFAIRGNGRTIVMDTGFNPVSAARRGRELLRTPAQALLDAGIDPAETKDVILTHMHWDHAGGMEYFPQGDVPSAGGGDGVLHRPLHVRAVPDAGRSTWTT